MPLILPASATSARLTTTASSASDWYGYAAFDGKTRVVATAYNTTRSIVSTDNGKTWAAGGALPSTSAWYGVGYIPTVFCAIIYGSRNVATSTDGTSWTSRTNALPTVRNWHRIVGGGGTLVAVVNGSQYVATSTDGITWSEAASMPSSANWQYIAYGNGNFVAIDYTGGSTKAAYSSDSGATWSAATLPTPSGTNSYGAIGYGGGVFLVCSNSASATDGGRSTDGGATWSSVTFPSPGAYGQIAYVGNGVFLAATATSAGAISYDLGQTWSAYTLSNVSWMPFVNTGDSMAGLARSSSTGMYLATSKPARAPILQAVTRAATW